MCFSFYLFVDFKSALTEQYVLRGNDLTEISKASAELFA